ncbi:PAS domain-containing protein [Sphingosinicella microcystinivorans]|nr:PAS domain-containing protein [Sphingosinicella microcystinivorans]
MTDRPAAGRLTSDDGRVGGQELQRLIDLIPALVWSAHADGTANFVSQHYLDYVGLSLEAVRDWQWTSAIHPEDRMRLMECWAAFRDAGTGGEVEARIRRHDGVYRWFLFRTSPQFDDEGNIIQWYGVNTDIDDQKRSAMMLAGEMRVLETIASGEPCEPSLPVCAR